MKPEALPVSGLPLMLCKQLRRGAWLGPMPQILNQYDKAFAGMVGSMHTECTWRDTWSAWNSPELHHAG